MVERYPATPSPLSSATPTSFALRVVHELVAGHSEGIVTSATLMATSHRVL
jgi:hypothetical protein